MKKSLIEKIITWIAFVIFFVYSISLLFPFVWMFFNSFKEHTDFVTNIWGMPAKWMFSNYLTSFKLEVEGFTLFQVFANTIVYVVVQVILTVTVPLITAYVVSKYRFALRGFCNFLVILMITVPVVGGEAATFKLLVNMGLYDRWYFGLWIMSLSGFGGSFLLYRAALDSTSWTYAEGAFMDGAGDLRVMVPIMFPMVKPMIIIQTVMGFIGAWNGWMGQWLYSPSYPTISLAIKRLSDEFLKGSNPDFPKLFAAMAVSLVPVLVVFLCFQKTIMNNFALGGLKG